MRDLCSYFPSDNCGIHHINYDLQSLICCITKLYEKAQNIWENDLNFEDIATRLKIYNLVDKILKNPALITIKNYKEKFKTSTKCSLPMENQI